MDKVSEEFSRQHRYCPAAAAMSLTTQFGKEENSPGQPGNPGGADPPTSNRGEQTSLGPLKQVDAGLLNVDYAKAGPACRPAFILLHGWPYEIYATVDVAPLLASAPTG